MSKQLNVSNQKTPLFFFFKSWLNVLQRYLQRAPTWSAHRSYWGRSTKDAFFNSPAPPDTTTTPTRRQKRNASLVFMLTTLWNTKLLLLASTASIALTCDLQDCLKKNSHSGVKFYIYFLKTISRSQGQFETDFLHLMDEANGWCTLWAGEKTETTAGVTSWAAPLIKNQITLRPSSLLFAVMWLDVAARSAKLARALSQADGFPCLAGIPAPSKQHHESRASPCCGSRGSRGSVTPSRPERRQTLLQQQTEAWPAQSLQVAGRLNGQRHCAHFKGKYWWRVCIYEIG